MPDRLQQPNNDSVNELTELQALKTRNRFLEALAHLSSELITTTEVKALFPAICKQLLDLTEADGVYIAFLTPDKKYLDLKYFAYSTQKPTLKRMKASDGVGGKAIQADSFVKIEDYQAFTKKVQHVDGIKSAIGQPIRRENKSNGVLTLMFSQQSKVHDVSPDLLEMFSVFVSSVVENAEMKHRMQQERHMQSAMLDINSAMHKSDNLTGIFDSVCTRIMESFNATRIRMYQYKNNSYIPKTGFCIRDGRVEQETTTDPALLKKSAVQWVVDHQQPALLKQGVKSDKESEAALKYRIDLKLGCSYVMPLIAGDNCWGILAVHRAEDMVTFRPFETRLLNLMASQLSIAIVRQQLIEDIEYDATHDSLTGLYNRISLNNRIERLSEKSSHTAPHATMLYIDLDGFKPVNDQFGHSIGDQLIRAAAKRIEAQLTGTSCVYRIGGDEFVVVIDSAYDEHIETTAKAICQALESKFRVEKLSLSISASIGIASMPLHTCKPDQLLPYADIAMYSAKHRGGGHIALYDEKAGAHHKHRVALKTSLSKAREQDEFDVYFQPKISCRTGEVEGVEALARWNHPQHGVVSPIDWIPFAEQTGEIHNIGQVLLNKACAWQRKLTDSGLELSMAVNISTRQLEADDFADKLVCVLEEHKVSPGTMEIELTESVMASDLADVSRKLDELSELGFKIALDDFGTGYSSLRYLQHLHLDVLKIDRSFIRDLNYEHGAFLAQTVMSIAQSLDLITVAEGVETADQIEAVVALGVDTIQGYYYSKPVHGDELKRTVQEINTNPSNPLKQHFMRKAA